MNADLLNKWYDICMSSDNVASEVLNCEEARNDLSVEQIKTLLATFGDDEFVTVNNDKCIVVLN